MRSDVCQAESMEGAIVLYMHLQGPYVLKVASLVYLGTFELNADRGPLSGVSEKSCSLGCLGMKRFARCGD